MQHSLLRLLAIGHQQNLELSRLVGNLADEHAGKYARQLRRLARRLAEGTPLVGALEQTPGVLSESDALAIRFGTQTGTLDRTYEQLLRVQDEPLNLRGAMVYSVVLFVVACSLLTFLAFYIFPVFLELYEMAGYPHPWGFRALLDVFTFASENFHWFVVAALIAFVLLNSTRFLNLMRRLIPSRLSGNALQNRVAELLRMLATSSEAGRPIPAALSTLARYHFDPQIRSKLLFARNEVEQGADVWSGLADAKLLTLRESEAFRNLSSNRTRNWAMRRLADQKHDQVQVRNRKLVGAIEPIGILLVASLVLWIGLAVFGSLANLIRELS